jgi:hypothetical protein
MRRRSAASRKQWFYCRFRNFSKNQENFVTMRIPVCSGLVGTIHDPPKTANQIPERNPVMMIKTTLLAAFATCVALTGNCQAQWVDYDSMIKESLTRQNQIVSQAEANTQQIVQQNMNDPQIQQMFRNYQAQGGPMNFQQYCHAYAATGGFQNVQGWINSEANIARNEANAVAEYQNYVSQLWTETNNDRGQVYDRIARERGDLLSGSTWYANPYSGGRSYLPYTASAGQVYTDYYGNTWTMGSNGNYSYGSNNGYNYEMPPVWGR